jgi:hypothetical protein
MLIPHFRCHHIFNIFIVMKVIINLILVEIDLYLIKLVIARDICKLALRLGNQLFLFASIIISASRNLIDEVLKAKLRLGLGTQGKLAVSMLL